MIYIIVLRVIDDDKLLGLKKKNDPNCFYMIAFCVPANFCCSF